ncbi:MAG TPA: J domain-containing protein [Acidimicrobiales bacterium]|nr:J domain-containing protein [Acidimicrobiales bacterium]
MRDPWSVLGVGTGATLEEARRAYLVRLQLVHPDRHQGSAEAVMAEAERATRELNAAWEQVSAILSAPPSPPAHPRPRTGTPPPSAPTPGPRTSAPPPPRGATAPPDPPGGPPTAPAACLQWAIERLVAAGSREGRPLSAAEVELLRRPRAAAPSGRRFERWARRRRATLAVAVAADGADAWATAVRVLSDGGPAVVLTALFSS